MTSKCLELPDTKIKPTDFQQTIFAIKNYFMFFLFIRMFLTSNNTQKILKNLSKSKITSYSKYICLKTVLRLKNKFSSFCEGDFEVLKETWA